MYKIHINQDKCHAILYFLDIFFIFYIVLVGEIGGCLELFYN